MTASTAHPDFHVENVVDGIYGPDKCLAFFHSDMFQMEQWLRIDFGGWKHAQKYITGVIFLSSIESQTRKSIFMGKHRQKIDNFAPKSLMETILFFIYRVLKHCTVKGWSCICYHIITLHVYYKYVRSLFWDIEEGRIVECSRY